MFCRPTISRDVLSVLFAVTPICHICCLDEQRDVSDVSLHFVLQVIFSLLSKYDILCNDREDLFFNVMYFLLGMN